MENRKEYHAPSAEIVLLAPEEAVTSVFGNNNGWWSNSAWWSNQNKPTASVVTGTLIRDEDDNSWTLP